MVKKRQSIRTAHIKKYLTSYNTVARICFQVEKDGMSYQTKLVDLRDQLADAAKQVTQH